MPRGLLLAAKDESISHYYFPESGIGSLIAISPEGLKAEAGLVGNEGVSPLAAILGVATAPYQTVMQVPGHRHRIAQGDFSRVLAANAGIHELFLRFAHTLSVQTAYTALSNAIHHVDERLARWILMCHDRTDSDEIELTHVFFAIMLAVRPPSVTTGLHVFEGNKLIFSERGLITIRDREGLESFASDAYSIGSRIPLASLMQTLVVAEYLIFRHAANALGVAQSSVSACVKALEEDLGILLFERHARGVRLTEAGRHFVERIAAGVDQLDHAVKTAGMAAAEGCGRLRIGIHAR